MIECSKLTVKYKDKTVLEDVSFSANKGEITVIIGKNGSGKTTLLRAVGKAVKFDGDIYINNENINQVSKKDFCRLVGKMTQVLPKPEVGVKELISFGRHPYTSIGGILTDKDKEVVNDCIHAAQLETIMEARVDKISGGERRKAFFGMLLAQKTPVKLLDEPTANLDSEYVKHFTKMLYDCKKRGDTLLIVLHDINYAFMIADKIIAIDKGKKVFEGRVNEATEKRVAENIFGLERLAATDTNGNKSTIYR